MLSSAADLFPAPPDGAARTWPVASDEDFAACRAILRQGSKSFHLASRLLPGRVRRPAGALYAFCRLADDAVDLHGGRIEAIDELAAQLDRVYGGAPLGPMERALSSAVRDHAVPRALLDALLEGLAWDAQGRRFEDFSALSAYAARVASTVGVITSLMMGVRDERALARAADLGVAMQLTNIARDIGEDARAGRVYLPISWMRDAGIDPDAWLADPVFDQRLAGVVRRLLEAADGLYRRAAAGVAGLPLACRPGIHAARLVYAEIGREVERLGDHALDRRAVVSPGRKMRLLAAALAASLFAGGRNADAAALAETRFLIEAIQASPAPELAPVAPGEPADIAWWHVDERIGRTIELFARLRQEELLQRAAGRR